VKLFLDTNIWVSGLIWGGAPEQALGLKVQALIEQVSLIISGDQDLLILRAFDGIQIVTARQALERLSV
jgi:predicted nucleic acid-binding protein